jgi:cation diffusion facilitator family transporter
VGILLGVSRAHAGGKLIAVGTAGGKQQAAARLSLLSNIGLVILKVVAGLASGSVSVLAEGIQSTVDVLASAFILLSVRAAAAPPDPAHPYGHGKFENLASLGQALLILGTAGYLLTAAWNRWHDPVMPRVDWGMAALTVSLIVNFFVSRQLLQVSRDTGSQALYAEAEHLRSDMVSCVGVLLGLGAVWATRQPRLDPLIAAVMTVVVAVSVLRLLRDTLRPLLDESLPADEEASVRRVLDVDDRVLGYHRLRTRRAGSDRLIDVHVLLDDHLSFLQAHDVAEDVERAIRDVLPNADVIVHPEPYEAEMRHQREHHERARNSAAG